MTLEEQNAAELAALLNGHQITDDEGETKVETETTEDQTADLKAQTTLEEPTPAEKPKEESKPAPKADDEDSETLVEDEGGNRYVPKSRFDKVYGKGKAAERRAEELERELQALKNAGLTRTEPTAEPQSTPQVDRTLALEAEILKGRLPQFDPDSDQYDPTLDQMGAQIYKANPGITLVEAARRAVKLQKDMIKDMAEVRAEARQIKTNQADQGITSRNTNASQSQVDYESMSDIELEAYLKKNGGWK